MSPNPMAGVPRRRGKFGHRDKRKKDVEARGRDQSHAPVSRGPAGNPQAGRGRGSTSWAYRGGALPAQPRLQTSGLRSNEDKCQLSYPPW